MEGLTDYSSHTSHQQNRHRNWPGEQYPEMFSQNTLAIAPPSLLPEAPHKKFSLKIGRLIRTTLCLTTYHVLIPTLPYPIPT